MTMTTPGGRSRTLVGLSALVCLAMAAALLVSRDAASPLVAKDAPREMNGGPGECLHAYDSSWAGDSGGYRTAIAAKEDHQWASVEEGLEETVVEPNVHHRFSNAKATYHVERLGQDGTDTWVVTSAAKWSDCDVDPFTGVAITD